MEVFPRQPMTRPTCSANLCPHATTHQRAHRRPAKRNCANQRRKPRALAGRQEATRRRGSRTPTSKIAGNPRRISVVDGLEKDMNMPSPRASENDGQKLTRSEEHTSE